ncbi:MAG: cell surface protein SprA [Caldithrix sp.]|nr:cell surface protein SprA [Caldithrix sp.]
MRHRTIGKVGRLPITLLAFINILFFWNEGQSQIGIQPPQPYKTVEIFQPELLGLQKIQRDSTLFPEYSKPSVFERQVKLDSTGNFITAREFIDQEEFLLPRVMDLNTYVNKRLEYETRELWKQMVIRNFQGTTDQGFGAIELDIPFRIKSKTFTRIFGSDRIGLRVTGNISFDLSGRTEKRSGSAVSAIENQNTFSPRFRQTQQFTVEGKIGEKVTVSVEQNSEATVDVENTLKLRYDGDEDEIVQKIEAGNISLSLPSTRYVMFGGSNKGLFGLKTQMQVGNLHFTGIASLEKGQQQELNISGGSQESQTTVKDIDFIKNQYFFASKQYRDHFDDGLAQDPQTFTYQQGTDILQLEVWRTVGYDNGNARNGIAVIDPTHYYNPSTGKYEVDYDTVSVEGREGRVEKGFFERLEPEKDYTFDKYRGYFKLKQRAQINQAIAIAYVTSSAAQNPDDLNYPIGTLNETLTDTNQVVILKLIKPKAMQPSYDETWPLMMRNVYSLGGTNIEQEGFEVRLEYNKTGTHDRYPDGGDKSFLNLLGLDLLNENGERVEGGDEQIDNNPYIVNRADGTLMFPSVRPFNPEEESRFSDKLPDKYHVDMYELSSTDQNAFLTESKFEMIITSKSTKSTFDLGFYVLEGSEVVTLGGRTLQRDKDYTIDYFSGQLTLTSPEAKRSSSQIQIKYERANLFQLDKKTIFGGRLEYRFLDNSFLGLTALYLNKSTLDQKVRVGQEPFRNFVWDLNAAFKFKPRFLTKAVDALPFVETNAESNINFEGEFAQVLPNPNTLNNEKTNDNQGVAYIDDFEAAKRTTTLGIRYRTWSMASPPKKLVALEEQGLSTPIDSVVNKSRANMSWFNPYHQVPIKDIWPNRDVNAQTGQTTDVLGIDLWRDEDTHRDSAWVGIMRSTLSFADQQKTKYIELWVKGDSGRAHINIGRISEDWYMKGNNVRGEQSYHNLNTEDRNNNGLLEENEDTGIDGIADGRPGDQPNDNWEEPNRGALNVYDGISYDGINGTEGNSQSRESRYPDTEDLDGDGQLSLSNEYFEYTFSLDPNAPDAQKWIKGSTEKGWRLFRIPIKDFTDKIGQPNEQFQQIFFVRLWFDQLPTERRRLFIATFDFVGNEWEETGIAENDTAQFVENDSLFSLETYNTEENAEAVGDREAYVSPPGVSGVVDRITKARSKEQSLVMNLVDFQPGQVAEAQKTLFKAMDLVNYKRMRMFVHGDKDLPGGPPLSPEAGDSSKIRFYLRFGSDQNNYYEYGQDIYAGWNTNVNNIDIDLDQLAKTKPVVGEERTVYLKGKPGAYYRAHGRPSLKTIRYFVIGVKHRGNDPGHYDPTPFTGQLWLDELRLSKVRKIKATAMRVSTNVQLADLLSFNAQLESKDADFHNISKQFGGGNTEERQNYSGKINLDKFLPPSWNISIPVDARASFSRQVPKYIPRSDELTGYRNDTFTQKVKSLIGLRDLPEELEDQVNVSEIIGVGTTIQKRSKSKQWYLKYTIDNLRLNIDYSKRHSSNWEIKYNDSKQIKESVTYNIPFGRNNFIQPLGFLKKIPLIKKFSDQKIYYTPDRINMSANVSDSKTEQLRRSQVDTVQNEVKIRSNTSSNRSISGNYKLLDNLSFNYSRSYRSDADFDSLTHKQLLTNILTKGDFGLDTDINQSFKADFRPDLFRWLRTNMSFNSNFSYQLTNGNKYKQSSNKTQKQVSLTFNPGQLLKTIYTPESNNNRGRPRGRRSARSSDNQNTEEQGDDQQQGQDEEEDKPSFSIPNPLMLLYDFVADWNSIKTNVTFDDQVSHKYLNDVPSWDFQFGLTRNPGVRQDSSLIDQNVNLIGPVRQQRFGIRNNTSFNLTQKVQVSLTHNYSEQESSSDYGQNRSGNTSSTYFAMGDNPIEDFDDLKGWRAFFPDWQVQISGVEKFLFFPTFAKSVNVTHSHSGKYSENRTLKLDGSFLPTSQTFSNNWQPLVGINLRTKWGISANMRMSSNTSYSFSGTAGASKTETSSMTLSLSYSKTTGFKIPIPVWPFKGKTFKNEINFNMTFDASENRTFQKQYEQKDFEEKQKTSSWKLRPSATYRFSKRVQGSLFYEMGANENKISGKYSYHEFGVTVNIAIRD